MPFAVTATKATHRAGDTRPAGGTIEPVIAEFPLPSFTGSGGTGNIIWTAPAGVIAPNPSAQNEAVSFAVPNRTQIILVTGTDAANVVVTTAIQIYATFPYLGLGSEIESEEPSIVSYAADKRTCSIRYFGNAVDKRTISLSRRPVVEYSLMQEFLNFHKLDIPFYVKDNSLGTLKLMRRDSAVKTVPQNFNVVDLSFVARDF